MVSCAFDRKASSFFATFRRLLLSPDNNPAARNSNSRSVSFSCAFTSQWA
ncbi:hypothetical protein Mp_4g19470 [Marchantia polymorpha subsp. ruderalis]|uniref:Uncharacterized protein n=1 Tax=Marchantia polymorpha subsp. ruderalis TaxID=1480154 RepID=A0AAF6BBL3_MARPO|nr:hypothetical protein Mp_4g19470 [Marchantia polymorpha subsp. ruderalis]